jgi:hypothetical protein
VRTAVACHTRMAHCSLLLVKRVSGSVCRLCVCVCVSAARLALGHYSCGWARTRFSKGCHHGLLDRVHVFGCKHTVMAAHHDKKVSRTSDRQGHKEPSRAVRSGGTIVDRKAMSSWWSRPS